MYVLNSDLPEKLIEAMRWELETRGFYEVLIDYVKIDEDRETIYYLIEDERRHYSILNELYIYLTDKKAEVHRHKPLLIENYIKIVELIISNTKHQYCLYRDIFLRSRSPYIKRIFSNLAADESTHTASLNHFYAKAVWL